MRKFASLGELLSSYRLFHKISQLDIASLLDVDVRTIIRWEKNESLVKSDKEEDIVKLLNIPHQVIRNLNTDKPIAIYYDFERRVYSLSGISREGTDARWYRSDLKADSKRIKPMNAETDLKFIEDIQHMDKNPKQLKHELLKQAIEYLPDLNLILYDQSGFFAGQVCVLPIKYESLVKLKNKELKEGDLRLEDLTHDFSQKPLVFYYYSLYADSLDNSYYLMNKLLMYFKEKKYTDYIFAGMSSRKRKIDVLKEMGLKLLWEENIDKEKQITQGFLMGNFDMFLFGTTM